MKSISQETFNSFNREQKELVKLLGLKVVKKYKKKSEFKVNCPKEYKLRVIEICSFCGSVKIHYYLMLKDGNKRNLISNKVSSEVFKRTKLEEKSLNQGPITCSSCPLFLAAMPKEKLIKMYLKLRRTNFNK